MIHSRFRWPIFTKFHIIVYVLLSGDEAFGDLQIFTFLEYYLFLLSLREYLQHFVGWGGVKGFCCF